MTAAMSLPMMDDNMSLGTPNFFSSAWNPEQNDFSFTEAFAVNHPGYAPQLLQGQVENNQLDYFSCQGENRFGGLSMYQPREPSGFSRSNDDLNRILENTHSEFLDKTAESAARCDSSDQPASTQGLASYHSPLYSSGGLGVASIDNWNPDVKPQASPSRTMTQIDNETDGRTSLRYGQITPVDSPPDDSLQLVQNATQQLLSTNTGHDSCQSSEAPKIKKQRKSKKKPMTKEQEESKRKKFLERNRVAADKCRQNRKKWIDDLQTKVHHFGADNAVKKAQLEELEQEIVQLRSMIFIHSRSCNEKDMINWGEHEANKVQFLGEKEVLEDKLLTFSQPMSEASSPSSRPTSSYGYGSVSEAVSRRYSEVTADDDFASAVSVQSSRKTSIAI